MNTKQAFEAIDSIIDDAEDVPAALAALAAVCSMRAAQPAPATAAFAGASWGSNPGFVPEINDAQWQRMSNGIQRLGEFYGLPD